MSRKYRGRGLFSQGLRSMNLYHEPSTSKLLSNLESMNTATTFNIVPVLVGWVDSDNNLNPTYADKFMKTYILFSEMIKANPTLTLNSKLNTALFKIGNFKTYYDKHAKIKSVTLYISMHAGENIDWPLSSSILNTVVSKIGRLGLCSWGPPISFINLYKKLVDLNIYFEGPSVIENNLLYSKEIHNKLDPQLAKELSKEHNTTWSEIGPEYNIAVNYKPSEHIRTYTHDKVFTIELDSVTLTQGIYIVGINNIDGQLYTSLRTPNRRLFPDPDKKALNILETILRRKDSIAHYKLNQSYNLLNTDYLYDISKKITGQQFGFDKSEKIQDYTNVYHYNKVYLSDILNYFAKLGVEHVNIIDESCRYTSQPTELLRQESSKEKQGWETFSTRINMGGRTYKKLKKHSTK
jgi:hypothetical protein